MSIGKDPLEGLAGKLSSGGREANSGCLFEDVKKIITEAISAYSGKLRMESAYQQEGKSKGENVRNAATAYLDVLSDANRALTEEYIETGDVRYFELIGDLSREFIQAVARNEHSQPRASTLGYVLQTHLEEMKAKAKENAVNGKGGLQCFDEPKMTLGKIVSEAYVRAGNIAAAVDLAKRNEMPDSYVAGLKGLQGAPL